MPSPAPTSPGPTKSREPPAPSLVAIACDRASNRTYLSSAVGYRVARISAGERAAKPVVPSGRSTVATFLDTRLYIASIFSLKDREFWLKAFACRAVSAGSAELADFVFKGWKDSASRIDSESQEENVVTTTSGFLLVPSFP